MAAKMGRKTMLRVANAVSDGVDPADWPRLKSKENLLLLKSPRFSRFETKEKIREKERERESSDGADPRFDDV